MVAFGLRQPAVPSPAAHVSEGAGPYAVGREAGQARHGGVRHRLADVHDARSCGLQNGHVQLLAKLLAVGHPRFSAFRVRCPAARRFPATPSHRLPQLLRPEPCHSGASQVRFSLQVSRTGSCLLRARQPGRQQRRRRQMHAVEGGASCQQRMVPRCTAIIDLAGAFSPPRADHTPFYGQGNASRYTSRCSAGTNQLVDDIGYRGKSPYITQ